MEGGLRHEIERMGELVEEVRGFLEPELGSSLRGDANAAAICAFDRSAVQRVTLLIPCIVERLEEDISHGVIGVDLAKEDLLLPASGEELFVLSGLLVPKMALQGILSFFRTHEYDQAIRLFSLAARKAMLNLETPHDDQPGRLFHDVARLAPDLRLFALSLKNLQFQRKTTLPAPAREKSWSPYVWCKYYQEQSMIDYPLLRFVRRNGANFGSLRAGYHAMAKEQEKFAKEYENLLVQRCGWDVLDRAFHPDDPESFLELSEIPLCDEKSAKSQYDPPCDQIAALWEPVQREKRRDPVCRLLQQFARRVSEHAEAMGCTGQREELTDDELLLNFVLLQLMHAQSKCAASILRGADCRAARQGAYLFARESLEKAKEVVASLGDRKWNWMRLESDGVIRAIMHYY